MDRRKRLTITGIDGTTLFDEVVYATEADIAAHGLSEGVVRITLDGGFNYRYIPVGRIAELTTGDATEAD